MPMMLPDSDDRPPIIGRCMVVAPVAAAVGLVGVPVWLRCRMRDRRPGFLTGADVAPVLVWAKAAPVTRKPAARAAAMVRVFMESLLEKVLELKTFTGGGKFRALRAVGRRVLRNAVRLRGRCLGALSVRQRKSQKPVCYAALRACVSVPAGAGAAVLMALINIFALRTPDGLTPTSLMAILLLGYW